MTFLVAGVGAIIAAIIETSVLPEAQVAGVSPDLVLVLTLVSAMLLGVEEGLIWAFVGGFMLDMLAPGERAAGSTPLTLLIMAGIALLVARVSGPPRILVVGLVAVVLTFAYEVLLLVVLALTSGVGLGALPFGSIAPLALLDGVLACAAAWVIRALSLRFGSEKLHW
jgi:rod shape-determining protein MreD